MSKQSEWTWSHEPTRYTAIYVESWSSGSHRHSITRMKRFQQKKNETVMEAVLAADIEPTSIVFLFEGWSKLEGEPNVPEL